jgi:hypothetical protein
MSAPAKLLHVIGMLGKEESTYGTFVTMSTTADGIQLQYADRNVAAPLSLEYAYDGDLGPSVGNLGAIQRVSPSGFSVKGDLPTRARPGGAAYSATVTPSIHRILKACGFDATVTTTTSSEKWVYTPSAPGNSYTSLSHALYSRGELWNVSGALGNIKMDFANPAPPIWTYSMMGIATLPSDAACPTITYPLATILPPLASSITLTLGSLSTNAVVMSGSFDMQRQLTPRVAVSASGAHLGFVPGDRKPIIKVVLEATALTTTPYTSSTAFDPYNLRDKATSIAASLQFGSTQYNKYKVAFAQAQVVNVVPQNNGPIATVELTLQAYNSSATAADDMSITFD